MERRVAPRTDLDAECVLRRSKGTPIPGRTVDVSDGGMRVCTDRPLGVDEVLTFDVDIQERHVDGRARVLRQQGGANVYALRFETLAPGAADVIGSFIRT